jgi:putative oxidoreductase
MYQRLTSLYCAFTRALHLAAPLVDLGLRLYVASVFFNSGLVKIQSWSSTLALFEYEYAVPLLPPVAAAWLGTAAELSLPVLLALFLFNIVVAISYPDLSEVGRQHHLYWGLLLAFLAVHGPGKLSLDAWLLVRKAG